jgi:oligopeptide transport system permease protein
MTVAKTEQLGALRAEAAQSKPRGLWSDAWRRLKKNKAALAGMAYIGVLALIAIFARFLAPHDPNFIPADALANTPPVWQEGADRRFLLGTDSLSRDILSRLIYGAQISLVVGFIPVALELLLGATVGIMSGWLGGRWDNILMRLVDVVYAFPSLLFFIVVSSALGSTPFGRLLSGLVLLFVAFAITGWVTMARLVRGQVLTLKNKEFIEAARSVGVPTQRIIWRHVIPNSLAPIIVSVTFGIPGYILAEAALSYLGLGIHPPAASWGNMVREFSTLISLNAVFVLMPAALIALTMLAFTFLGDGLRDALDPQMTK